MKLPIIILAAVAAAPAVYSQVFYTQDFSSVVGGEWSSTTTSTTPAGARPLLGEFNNNTVALSLSALPAHGQVTVSFDLFLIRTWDGNSFADLPNQEHWKLSIGDSGSQSVVLDTTFSNVSGRGQAYPDNFDGVIDHVRYTGAAEANTLGYFDSGSGLPLDSVYNLTFTLPHGASTLTAKFEGYGLEPISNESWGIGNVQVGLSAVPEPGEYAAVFGLGLAGFAAWRRHSRKVASSAVKAA